MLKGWKTILLFKMFSLLEDCILYFHKLILHSVAKENVEALKSLLALNLSTLCETRSHENKLYFKVLLENDPKNQKAASHLQVLHIIPLSNLCSQATRQPKRRNCESSKQQQANRR